MDDLATQRIITLIDMDCFYCQVESRLNPDLKGKPVAVVQYNQWKQGGIVAVSYEARARGVTRFMRGEEAKKTCPELNLVSIPCVRGKADLTKYRDAGAEVAAVFTTFSDCVQRASVDEAFIDLTQVVEKRIASGTYNLDVENFPSTYVVGFCDLKNSDKDMRKKGTTDWIKQLTSGNNKQSAEYRLAVGALIVEEMRAAVLKNTGFHCSAGIAHNKVLAKVIAGLHKPKCQTVLPHDSVPELYETLPVNKVRSLGGKFGKLVVKKLSITNMSELYQYSKNELQNLFDEKQGSWLYDIARGVEHDPVNPRLIPDSIGCCKNFWGKMALKTPSDVMEWLSGMAEEVSERLGKDYAENKRRAKLLTVIFKSDDTLSRSCPLTSYETQGIALSAFELLKKFNRAPPDSNQWDPPLQHLGLSASKFTSEQTSTITKFFKAGEIPEKKNGICDISSSNSKENCLPSDGGIEEESAKESSSSEPINLPSDKLFGIKRFIKTDIEKESADVEIAEESNITAVGASDNNEANKKSSGTSFFAKFLKREIKEEDAVQPQLNGESFESSPSHSLHQHLPEPLTSKVSSMAAVAEPYLENDLFQICPDCNGRIHLSVYLDHLDFHAAVKLDKEINKITVKTVTVTRSPLKRKGSPVKKKKKTNISPNQCAITTFFESTSK